MLVRDSRRLVLLGVLFVAFVYGVVWYRAHDGPIVASDTVGWVGDALPGSNYAQPAPASPDRPEPPNVPDLPPAPGAPAPPSPPEPPAAPAAPFPQQPAPPAEPAAAEPQPPAPALPAPAPAQPGNPVAAALAALPPLDALATHNELFSTSTVSKEYFEIRFGDQKTLNPNILPHPTRAHTWIIVAQKHKTADEKPQWWFSELVCAAAFADDVLACTGPPQTLPIAATGGGRCEGALDYFNLNVGPHDARVFYGPGAPYVLYGSNSGHTCFGEWLQDFRALYPWDRDADLPGPEAPFRLGAELQRPPPWAQPVEKNWFLFWDAAGRAYVHHDLAPRRVFAALRADGSVGPDLAAADAAAAARDAACLARRLPALAPADESLHQATNSLAVTLCRRADGPACARRADNTVLLALFHHKSFHGLVGQYEPYVVLFDDAAPFALRALGTRPLWLAGRRRYPDDARHPTDMLFVTSIAWRAPEQTYHGFLDDVLFVAFGVEDERSAALDVRAEDLLRGMGLCEDEA